LIIVKITIHNLCYRSSETQAIIRVRIVFDMRNVIEQDSENIYWYYINNCRKIIKV